MSVIVIPSGIIIFIGILLTIIVIFLSTDSCNHVALMLFKFTLYTMQLALFYN